MKCCAHTATDVKSEVPNKSQRYTLDGDNIKKTSKFQFHNTTKQKQRCLFFKFFFL